MTSNVKRKAFVNMMIVLSGQVFAKLIDISKSDEFVMLLWFYTVTLYYSFQ